MTADWQIVIRKSSLEPFGSGELKKDKIKGLKGHNGIKQRKYRFQETVVLEAEFSSKSSKSGRGLSGMDTPSKTLRFYYIFALKKNVRPTTPHHLPGGRKDLKPPGKITWITPFSMKDFFFIYNRLPVIFLTFKLCSVWNFIKLTWCGICWTCNVYILEFPFF